MAREPYDEPTFVVDPSGSLVPCLGPRCSPRRRDITPKPARPARPPKPRQEVRPQQREETKQRKQEETKARARQRPGARPQPAVEAPRLRRVRVPRPSIPVAAIVSVLVVIIVAANIDAIVAAVLYALLFLALTVVALAAGYANGRWVVPALVRLLGEQVAERRDRTALREVLAAPIAIEPVPEHDVQEWINRGLRNRRIDGYVAEPVERKR